LWAKNQHGLAFAVPAIGWSILIKTFGGVVFGKMIGVRRAASGLRGKLVKIYQFLELQRACRWEDRREKEPIDHPLLQVMEGNAKSKIRSDCWSKLNITEISPTLARGYRVDSGNNNLTVISCSSKKPRPIRSRDVCFDGSQPCHPSQVFAVDKWAKRFKLPKASRWAAPRQRLVAAKPAELRRRRS